MPRIIIALLVWLVAALPSFAFLASGNSPVLWHTVKIGGGGYMTGIAASADGATIVARTDHYGAYIWEPATTSWRQLFTLQTAGFNDATGVDWVYGAYEIAVAPGDANRIYLATGGIVWKSADRGTTFSQTSLTYATRISTLANDTARYMGQKMAVDPINPDVVYFGTPQAGVYYTFDGGVTWTQILNAAIPFCVTTFSGAYPGHPGIVFDPNSGTTGGKTNTIYVPSYGNGVWQTTDAGATWQQLSGAPTKVRHAKISPDSFYYSANNTDNNDATRTLTKWNTSAWSAITPPGTVDVESVLIDLNDASRVIAARSGGGLMLSQDRGSTWGTTLTSSRASPNIPWLAWTLETFLSLGDVIFNPADPTTIWFAEGIGTWTGPFVGVPTSILWTANTQGIENLSVNDVIMPPSGKPVTCQWDRPIFYVADPEVYPSTHGPNNNRSIAMCWAIDYATSDPTFIVYAGLYTLGVDPFGYKSTDGGQNWSSLGAPPAAVVSNQEIGSGGVAVSSPTNFIIVTANNGVPYYTLDGVTFTKVAIAGTPPDIASGDIVNGSNVVTNLSVDTSNLTVGFGVGPITGKLPHTTIASIDSSTQVTLAANATADSASQTIPFETGWNSAYYLDRRIVAADRVAGGTFYIYNYVTNRIYRTIDGGITWARMNASDVGDASRLSFHAVMKTVPGQQGHLFLASGQVGNIGGGNPSNIALLRSTDAGVTWTSITTIKEPYCIGFGVSAPGQSYPAIYVVGWYNNSFGVFRSTDNAGSWVRIGNFPVGWLAEPRGCDASKEIFGMPFLAQSGPSYSYGTPQ